MKPGSFFEFQPSIVYEDSDLLVINKPAGLITHPKNDTDHSYSLAQWIRDNRPEAVGIGEYSDRPGIVHRLDRETSGLIVVAKNQESFNYLKELFQTRRIKKTYQAIVLGIPHPLQGTIDKPIGRIGLKRTTLPKKGKLKDKKEAVTEYRVERTSGSYSLLEIRPQTGRTHQIRVHLQSIGHPIVGDHVYGRRPASSLLIPNRLYLHASRLDFTTPSGQALVIECDLPPDFGLFLKEAGQKTQGFTNDQF